MAKHSKHKAHKKPHGKGAVMPGPHVFSGPQEAAMRQGMRADRGAPPTDGGMPQGAPPMAAGPSGPPSPGGDGDFDDL